MNSPGSPEKLPAALRNVALLCMALAALVGFFSMSELLGLVHVADVSPTAGRLPGPLGSEAFQRGFEAQLSALESMRVARVLTLASLGLACALNLVSASRLIWPRGWRLNPTAPALPREGMRKLIVASSVAVALLRTLDGAQLAVVARRVGAAMGRSASSMPAFASASPAVLEAKLRSWAVTVAVLQTAVVVGAFAFFSHYFRSQRVRGLLAALDQAR